MKKPQIKEYLSSIYGMQVLKINTANYEGVRALGPGLITHCFLSGKKYHKQAGQKMSWFKRKDWKKAVVTYKKEGQVLTE